MSQPQIPVKISLVGVSEVKSALKDLGGVMAGVFAAEKLKSFAEMGIREFSDLQAASNGLSAALGKQSDALISLAKTESITSTFKQSEIEQGYKRLALYGLTEAQIKKIAPTMLDLAAVTGSTESASKLLGQAIERGTGRLGQYGITLNKNQSISERFNSVLAQAQDAFAGQEKAAFEAMNPLDKMHKLMENLGESVGEVLVPELNNLYDTLPDLANQFQFATKAILTAGKLLFGGFEMIVLAIEEVFNVSTGLLAKIPGPWHKTLEGLHDDTDKSVKAIEKSLADNFKSIDALWAEHAEKPRPKRKKIVQDQDVGGDDAKKAKESEELMLKIQTEADEAGLDENEKKMSELGKQYEKEYDLLKGNKKEQEKLSENYNRAMTKLAEEETEIVLKKKEEEKEKLDKFNENQQKALIKIDDIGLGLIKNSYNKKSLIIKRSHESERSELKKDLDDGLISQKQYSDALILIKRDENQQISMMQQAAQESALNETVKNLQTLASKHKEWADVYKASAIAQATIDTYKSAESVYAGFSTIPIVGQGLGIAGAAIAIAAGIANVQQIAAQKMAMGGVVTGGIPGVDSVLAMLMPGEIVYNPANPNPALAAMVNNNSTSTTSHTHIHGPTITVQGNVTKSTLNDIQAVSEKALINAMRKAQYMGKISATGLKLRN